MEIEIAGMASEPAAGTGGFAAVADVIMVAVGVIQQRVVWMREMELGLVRHRSHRGLGFREEQRRY